jgi:hypothetical protein
MEKSAIRTDSIPGETMNPHLRSCFRTLLFLMSGRFHFSPPQQNLGCVRLRKPSERVRLGEDEWCSTALHRLARGPETLVLYRRRVFTEA